MGSLRSSLTNDLTKTKGKLRVKNEMSKTHFEIGSKVEVKG